MTNFLRTTLALSLALAACAKSADESTSVPAANLASVSPADENAADQYARIEAVLQDEVERGVRSGFVAMIADEKNVLHTTAVGLADIEASTAMSAKTRFRIASMTKPITTVALLMLVEEGRVLLNDPVALYIPAFADMRVATSPFKDETGAIPTEALVRPVTIHHLLTHTAGLGYVFDNQTDLGKAILERGVLANDGDLKSRIDIITEYPLYQQPGEKWQYSFATDVAGRIVEIASGMSLEAFMDTNIFMPLKMADTEFFFDQSDFDRLATVYTFDDEGAMIPFDGGGLSGSPNKNGTGWYSGGAGLVSTAGDYVRFLQMLLNEGELEGARILSPATVRLMLDSHVSVEARPEEWRNGGLTFGLGGWVLEEPGLSGNMSAAGQFGWGGYYDTTFAISPQDGLAYVVLAQREPGPNDKPSRAGDLVRSIAFGALDN